MGHRYEKSGGSGEYLKWAGRHPRTHISRETRTQDRHGSGGCRRSWCHSPACSLSHLLCVSGGLSWGSLWGWVQGADDGGEDSKNLQNSKLRTSLVVQWLRICLPVQGTRVRSLVWEVTSPLWKSPSAGTPLSFISFPFILAQAVSLPGAAKPRSIDIINSAFC